MTRRLGAISTAEAHSMLTCMPSPMHRLFKPILTAQKDSPPQAHATHTARPCPSPSASVDANKSSDAVLQDGRAIQRGTSLAAAAPRENRSGAETIEGAQIDGKLTDVVEEGWNAPAAGEERKSFQGSNSARPVNEESGATKHAQMEPPPMQVSWSTITRALIKFLL